MLRSLIESGRIWVVAVVGLLLLNMCVCAVTVVAATSNPVASAVEPDYYQKAVDWDRSRAEWPDPAKLGWSVTIVDLGSGVIEVSATDLGAGTRAQIQSGELEARHAGETLVARTANLAPERDGRLLWAPGDLDRGLWSITVRLQGDGGQVMQTQKLMVGD